MRLFFLSTLLFLLEINQIYPISVEIISMDRLDANISKMENFSNKKLLEKINSGTFIEKISGCYLLGKFYFSQKEFKLAKEYFEKALQQNGEVLASEMRYKLLVNIGLCYKNLQIHNKAIEQFRKAEEFIPITVFSNEKALLLYDYASVYYDWGHFDSATVCLQKSIQLFSQIGNEKGKAADFLLLGAIAQIYNKNTIALEYFEKCLTISNETKLKNLEINALLNIGILYEKIGNFDKAALFFRKSLSEAKSDNQLEIQVNTLNHIARLFAEKQDIVKAEECLQEALKLLQQINSPETEISVLNNCGTVYKMLKNYPKSMDCFHKIDSLQQSRNLCKINTDLLFAELYKLQNDFKGALFFLEKSLKFNNGNLTTVAKLPIYFQYAEIFLYKKDYANAEKFLLKVLDDIKNEKTDNLNELESAVYLRLSDLYKLQNNAEKALFYYQKNEQLKIQNFEKSYNFELAKIQNESDMAKMVVKNQMLKLEQEKNQLKIQQQKRNLIIVFSILFILLGFLIFISALLKKRNFLYKELVSRNIELSKNTPFQAEKAKIEEIHDEDKERSKKLITDLVNLFEKEKIYLDNSLNLNFLADKLETNRTYLSKAINDVLETNLNNLINKYRVEEARKMICDASQKLSIEGIGQSVGFNSKSTFNTAFKQFTGLTPTLFRQSLKDESS